VALALLVAAASAASSLGRDAPPVAFDEIAHLLPPGAEVVTVPAVLPEEEPGLPPVIRYDDVYGDGARAEEEPPPRLPLVFVQDLDGDGADEIAAVTWGGGRGGRSFRATVFARGAGGWRAVFGSSAGQRVSGPRGSTVFLQDRDSPGLRLDLGVRPPRIAMVSTGPFKIMRSRVATLGGVPASWDHGKGVRSAEDLTYGSHGECNGALLAAEALHARGESDLAAAICGSVAEAAAAQREIAFHVANAHALLGDIRMDLGHGDAAMRHYDLASRDASPYYRRKLVADYYRNRGMGEEAERQLRLGAEELHRRYARSWWAYLALLATTMGALGGCGWFAWRRRFALGAKALFAVLAWVLMAVYLHGVYPRHAGAAAGDLHAIGVLVLLAANVASVLSALGFVAITLLVSKHRTRERMKRAPLELLLVLPGLYAVGAVALLWLALAACA
jgi:hypothetical protein